MSQPANAYPRKHFFFEMFTRDISLQACILDLIDNSIDGLIRSSRIDVSADILKPKKALTAKQLADLPTIRVSYSQSEFSIQDQCGGIAKKAALTDVFNFGHDPDEENTGHLGVYGIGLKRAIFKIGDVLDMSSWTKTDSWEVKVNLRSWAKKDSHLTDWTFPLVDKAREPRNKKLGTRIVLKTLHKEVVSLLSDESWTTKLIDEVGRTYCYFLDRYVRIFINDEPVQARRIPLAESTEIQAGIDRFETDGVKVVVMAGLNAPDESGQENAGWYVLCNARVTVSADKSDLTGWGVGGSAAFHSKFNRFVGMIFFHADDPEKLPWTTTKRGLNRESKVYLQARGRMTLAAKPVLTFLSKMYPADVVAEPVQRELAGAVKSVDARHLVSQPTRVFQTRSARTIAKTTVRIQFDAEIRHLEAIKKHVRKSLSANKIGELTFNYYLTEEGLK